MKPGFQTFEMGTHFAPIFRFQIGLVICCMLITYCVIQGGWNIAWPKYLHQQQNRWAGWGWCPDIPTLHFKNIWKVDVRGNKCGCMLVKERIYGALVEVNIAERVECHTEDILLIECAFFPLNPEHIDNKKVHNLAFCACIYSVCILYSVCFHFTHWKVLKWEIEWMKIWKVNVLSCYQQLFCLFPGHLSSKSVHATCVCRLIFCM